MKPRPKIFIITVFLSILIIPILEYGHYIMAKRDNATITDTNFIGEYNQDGLTNPHILVNEFTFSSIPSLIAFYLAGFFVTFSIGSIFTIVLIHFRSRYWICAFSWVVIAPLASLNDIDRAIELMGPVSLAKWVYVGLGALSMYQLYQIRPFKKSKIKMI